MRRTTSERGQSVNFGSPQFLLSFISLNNAFHSPCSVIHVYKPFSEVIRCFLLSLLHLVCPVSVNVSKPPFLVMYPRNINSPFLILSTCVLFISKLIKTSPLLSYSVHAILKIRPLHVENCHWQPGMYEFAWPWGYLSVLSSDAPVGEQ